MPRVRFRSGFCPIQLDEAASREGELESKEVKRTPLNISPVRCVSRIFGMSAASMISLLAREEIRNTLRYMPAFGKRSSALHTYL